MSNDQVAQPGTLTRMIPAALAIIAALFPDAPDTKAADSPDALAVRSSRITGLATFVTASDGGAIPDTAAAGKTSASPADFLREHGHLFGVKDVASQLAVSRTTTDNLRHTHTTYQQVHKGVPVFSGVLKVHQRPGGAVYVANGDFYPIPRELDAKPELDAPAAVVAAKATIDARETTVEKLKLVIVDPGWYGGRPIGPHLAYYVILVDRSVPLREAFFVDARNARILDRWSVLYTDLYREVWDNRWRTLVRAEGDPPTDNYDENAAYDYSGDFYKFFERAFGRDGIDDAGWVLKATMHLMGPYECPNAYWDGAGTVFCNGVVGDDVVAHEWGHGMTEFTAHLIYQYQPGQLNESFSDIWGELIDLFNGNAAFPGTPGGTPWPMDPTHVGPGTDTPNNLRTTCSWSPDHVDGVRWLAAEDATNFDGAIRDMWDPTCFGDPDRAYSPLQTCDPYDNGGVHSGSGIPNHAFAILTDGKAFNGYTVSGIGPIKAAAVWYRALTTYLTVASDFTDAYYALNQAAADLIGTDVIDPRDGSTTIAFTDADALEVDKALLAVEMHTEGACGSAPASLAACGPDAGDCCAENGTPGCADDYCCNYICYLEPHCCESIWDDFCAEVALAFFPSSCSAPAMPEPDPSGAEKNRSISVRIPQVEGPATQTALRVLFTSLHHPPAPPDAPDFSDFEGQSRYVNAIKMCRGGTEPGDFECRTQEECTARGLGGTCDQMHTCVGGTEPGYILCRSQQDCEDRGEGGMCQPSMTCPDSLAFETSFMCARLGCVPEFRDWAGELNGAILHVSDSAIVPSSQYDVAQLHSTCQESPCDLRSEELSVFTPFWGNVDDDPLFSVLDVAAVVDKVKERETALIKPRTQLQPDTPDPFANVNVLDAANTVDSLKEKPYPFTGPTPCD